MAPPVLAFGRSTGLPLALQTLVVTQTLQQGIGPVDIEFAE